MIGAEITFKNGEKILLGYQGSDISTVTLSKKAKHIHIENCDTSAERTRRIVRFFDGQDSSIDTTGIFNPAFTVDLPKKTIDAGYELIGISLTIDTSGSWLNFLLWPENRPFV
jgi:hypothetical protein